ncbi:MAG: hypothetical protein ACYC26_09295 [Phycisphaerales bacterium]
MELLVVISIIALLLAILLPGLSKAKAAARGAVCLSNQHQSMAAVLMYAGDYNNVGMPQDGRLPYTVGGPPACNAANWPLLMMHNGYLPDVTSRTNRYVVGNFLYEAEVPPRNAFSCPEVAPTTNTYLSYGTVNLPPGHASASWSYGTRVSLSSADGESIIKGGPTDKCCYFQKMLSLRNDYVYMADSVTGKSIPPIATTTDVLQNASVTTTWGPASWTGAVMRRHSDAATVSFPDGHGALYSASALANSYVPYSLSVTLQP